jgi:hypothetical protein
VSLTHQLAPAGLFVWHLLKQAAATAPHSRPTFICTQLYLLVLPSSVFTHPMRAL